MNKKEITLKLVGLLSMSLGDKYNIRGIRYLDKDSLEIRIEDFSRQVKILSIKNGCIIKSNMEAVLEGVNANIYTVVDAIASALGSDIYLIDKGIDCDQIKDDSEYSVIYDILGNSSVSFVYTENDDTLNVVCKDSNGVCDMEKILSNVVLDDLSVKFKYKLKTMRDFIIESSISGGLYRSFVDANDIEDVSMYFKKVSIF